MSRKSIQYLANHTVYLIRGNPKQRCFYSISDYDFYLDQLLQLLKPLNIALHAYALTRRQVHLLMTPATESGIPLLLEKLESNYIQRMISRCYTSRSVWTDKDQVSIVQAQTFLLICSQYIEYLPVALGLCEIPAQHPWSSFKHNALGRVIPIITEHSCYLNLGKNRDTRSKRYSDMFGQYKESRYRLIRLSLQQNRPLGNKSFAIQVQQGLSTIKPRSFLELFTLPGKKDSFKQEAETLEVKP